MKIQCRYFINIGIQRLMKDFSARRPRIFAHYFSLFRIFLLSIFFSFSLKPLGENKNVNGAKTEWQKSITIHFCFKSKFPDSFSIIAVYVFFYAKNSPKILGGNGVSVQFLCKLCLRCHFRGRKQFSRSVFVPFTFFFLSV